MQRTPTTTDCVRFLQNPNINPKTGYYIHPLSPDYQRYIAQCGQPNRPMSPATKRTLTEELMFLTPSFKNTEFPGQQVTIPTQQKVIPMRLGPNFYQQLQTNVPFQQTTIPFQQQTNVPFPQQRPNVPLPGQQTNVPIPQQRPNIPLPGQQINVPFPGQQRQQSPTQRPASPIQQRQQSPIQRPASPMQQRQSPIQQPASPIQQRQQSPIQRPASPMQQRQQLPIQRPASPIQRPASPMQQRLMPQQNNYYPQDAPTAAEFKFNVPEEHQALVQASIEVARSRYPSFDLYIQAAEVADVLEYLRDRRNYPSYFRDASPFEIFKIYEGAAADRARDFLREFIQDHVDERGDATEKEVIDDFMAQHGYRSYYMGYLKEDDPSVQAYFDELPLTSENFAATITPDKAILMEMYRKKALQGGIANMTMFANKDRALLFIDYKGQGIQYDNGPILQSIGFKRDALRERMSKINVGRNQRRNNITRDYIRYEGETAINANGNDITDKRLSMSSENRVPYYSMVYNQLRERGLVQ